MLDELEDVLIQADLGVATAGRIREAVGKGRYDKTIEPDEVKAILAAEVEKVLAPVARAARDRRGAKAVRDPGRRRQRLGQDHDDRQARGQASRAKAAR